MEAIYLLNNMYDYHWVWYLLGFIFCPRLTIMIAISLHLRQYIPLWLFVFGWAYYAIIELLKLALKEA